MSGKHLTVQQYFQPFECTGHEKLNTAIPVLDLPQDWHSSCSKDDMKCKASITENIIDQIFKNVFCFLLL